MKRTLSLVLALVMVLGSFSTVFAAPAEKTAIEILNELGVILGDEAGLRPNDPLKREEAVVMIARLKGAIEEAQAWETAPTFEDVPNHYKAIIGWGQADGTFEGHSETKFGFGEAMTAKQYAVVLLKILGYSDVTWATVEEMAEEVLGFENLDGNFTRGIMAEMTLVALETEVKGEGVTLAEKLEVELPKDELTMEVKATKANELTITFNKEIDTEDITLAVTRGAANVSGKFAWNAGKTVATFTADANMTNGTYTVTATSKADEEFKVVGTTDVVARYIDKIVVLNDVALTGDSSATVKSDLAFVYYDVVDQYGESVRNTTNITWTSSVGGHVPSGNIDRAIGEIKLQRTNQQFIFGEKIFISGVDSKSGKSVQKELTVGQPRALDQIEVEGFVQKGTNKVVEELPAGFKDDTYHMVFEAKDQNGNYYPVNSIQETDITFVSDNPLLIREIKHDGIAPNVKVVVIDGIEYGAVLVQPGINVDRGGEVNIMAIAARTGKQTTKNIVVGENVILKQFDMLSPVGVTAEGENIEIPFLAYDQNGNAITNFRSLARHTNLNSLTFSQPNGGNLVLSEQADGTAKLHYNQGSVAWNVREATDGIDRPVSLTSIVTGGNSSTVMLSISDKARPVGIKSVTMDNVLVHKGETTVRLTGLHSGANKDSFLFVDQYGREMSTTAYNSANERMVKQAYDFFVASKAGSIITQDFNGYEYAIKVTYKGNDSYYSAPFNANDLNTVIDTTTNTFTLEANHNPATVASGMALRFEIIRTHGTTGTETVSPVKVEPLTIINIKQVRSIEISEMNKVHVDTDETPNIVLSNDAKLSTNVTGTTPHNPKVEVVGKYNNETVTIPVDYIKPSANNTIAKLTLGIDSDGDYAVNGITSNMKYRDLYDATTARLTRKDAVDTISIAVYDNPTTPVNVYTTASRVVSISDAAPRITTISGPDTWTVRPGDTNITAAAINTRFAANVTYEYLDQYGEDISTSLTPLRFRVSQVVENAEGYVSNNFSYSGNDSSSLSINGAERGDTFVLTIVAMDNSGAVVTKDIKVTVGADTKSNITNGTNNYLNDLINNTLEPQRIISMN